jgi:hypothetical protein
MMKRITTIWPAIFAVCSLLAGMALADNFPAAPQQPQAPPAVHHAKKQPELFYGYVPPAPIRHTWPGGYRVIILEMGNTFMEHLLGRY